MKNSWSHKTMNIPAKSNQTNRKTIERRYIVTHNLTDRPFKVTTPPSRTQQKILPQHALNHSKLCFLRFHPGITHSLCCCSRNKKLGNTRRHALSCNSPRSQQNNQAVTTVAIVHTDWSCKRAMRELPANQPLRLGFWISPRADRLWLVDVIKNVGQEDDVEEEKEKDLALSKHHIEAAQGIDRHELQCPL